MPDRVRWIRSYVTEHENGRIVTKPSIRYNGVTEMVNSGYASLRSDRSSEAWISRNQEHKGPSHCSAIPSATVPINRQGE